MDREGGSGGYGLGNTVLTSCKFNIEFGTRIFVIIIFLSYVVVITQRKLGKLNIKHVEEFKTWMA